MEQIHIINKEPSIVQQIRHTKQEIDKILGEEVEKNIRLMKQRYYEAGPRAAKLLAWRLKKQQAENTTHKLRDPTTNKITNNLDGIQKAFERYYKHLCSQSEQVNNHSIAKFLSSLDLPTLGKDAIDKLISPITKEGISKAIYSLNTNKSPGTDGFPPEW